MKKKINKARITLKNSKNRLQLWWASTAGWIVFAGALWLTTQDPKWSVPALAILAIGAVIFYIVFNRRGG